MTTTVPEQNDTPLTAFVEPKLSAVRDELKADPEQLAALIAELPDYDRTLSVAELRDAETDFRVLHAFAALCEALSIARKQDLTIKSGATWEIVRPATEAELTDTAVRNVWSKRYQAWRKATQS